MYQPYIELECWPEQIIHVLFAISDTSRFHLGEMSDLENRALHLGSRSGSDSSSPAKIHSLLRRARGGMTQSNEWIMNKLGSNSYLAARSMPRRRRS